MIKAIITDLDGTLFKGHSDASYFELSKRNQEALYRLKKAGIHLCINSGRHWSYGLHVLKCYQMPEEPCGYYNGSGIIDNGQIVLSSRVSKELIIEVCEKVKDADCQVILQYEDGDRITSKHDPERKAVFGQQIKEIGFGRYLESNIEEFLLGHFPSDVAKFLVIFTKADAECERIKNEIIEQLSDRAYCCSSYPWNLEIGVRDCSKGTFVDYIRSKYHLNADEVAVVGDGNNDVEMAKSSNMTFAINDGSQEMIDVCRFVVEDVAECADICLTMNSREIENETVFVSK